MIILKLFFKKEDREMIIFEKWINYLYSDWVMYGKEDRRSGGRKF